MGEAIGQSLPLAVGVALSPVPIIAVVLMLTTARARANGPTFVLGWLVGLGVVGAVVLALAGPGAAGEEGQPAAWVSWLKLLLGLGLVLVAVRQFRGRPRGDEEAPLPKWMGAIDRFGPGQAVGGGAVLAGANPKNLLLAVGRPPPSPRPGSRAASRRSPTPSSPSSAPWGWGRRWASTSPWASGRPSCWAASRAGWATTTPSSWPCCAWSSG
jgi:threonine/homoserine/homoserine lactone efflux protein